MLLSSIDALSREGGWHALTEPDKKIAQMDCLLRFMAGCAPMPDWLVKSAQRKPVSLSVSEIATRVMPQFPGMSRARLRSVLASAERKQLLKRTSHGHYQEDTDIYSRDIVSRLEKSGRLQSQVEERWAVDEARKDLRQATVFLCHYLLPHLPVYRKARALGMSDRAYFYALSAGIAGIFR